MAEIKPGDLAREYAARFPDVEGVIEIEALRPKGKGGRRGYMRTLLVYYFAGGKAAQTRATCKDEHGGRNGIVRSNGLCKVCGRIYLDTVVIDAYAPEPRAGREFPPVSDNVTRWPGYSYLYAEKSCVAACPDCVETFGLEVPTKYRPYQHTDHEAKVHHVEGVIERLLTFPHPRERVVISLAREGGTDYLQKCQWCEEAVPVARGAAVYCRRCHHRADAPTSKCDCGDEVHEMAEEADEFKIEHVEGDVAWQFKGGQLVEFPNPLPFGTEVPEDFFAEIGYHREGPTYQHPEGMQYVFYKLAPQYADRLPHPYYVYAADGKFYWPTFFDSLEELRDYRDAFCAGCEVEGLGPGNPAPVAEAGGVQ